MDSNTLQPWQIEAILTALQPYARYIWRLKQRMERVGFPRDDPVYVLVAEIQHKLQDLRMDLHYRGCGSGVGRASDQDKPRR